MTSTTRRKILPAVANLLLVVLSVCVALGFCEAFLRFRYYRSLMPPDDNRSDFVVGQHPTRGFALLPNRNIHVYSLNWNLAVTTNSRGLRDAETAYDPKPGVSRIVVLGDSFMDGYQVDLSEGLPALLERSLAPQVEVVNLGVRGYGTVQELLYLKEEGLKYKPDTVLLAFYPLNDFYDNYAELGGLMWGADYWQHAARTYGSISDSGDLEIVYPDPQVAAQSLDAQRRKQMEYTDWLASRSWYQRTAIFQTYERAAKTRHMAPTVYDYNPNVHLGAILKSYDPESAPKANITADEYARMWAEAFRVTEQALVELKAACDEAGARLVVIMVPAKEQVDTVNYLEFVKQKYPRLEFDLEKPNRWLAETAYRHALEYVDLLPAFREHYALGGRPLFHTFDSHWNAAGHRLAARELAAHLERVGAPSEYTGRR